MSGSSTALGANTSASTMGARARNSWARGAASRSRIAPRPRGVASRRTNRRTTSTPRSATPLHRPATTHSVPPRAACSSGQRSRRGPPHLPATASASTTPPCDETGSSRRTAAATVSRFPSPDSRPHVPAHLGPPSDLHQLHGPRPAAGRQPHLAESLEQRHVELGFLLVAVEPQLHQHLALRRGHVARGQPVEGVYQHVAAARVAAAEPRQLRAQLRVLALHHLVRHVRYPTTASSWPTVRAAKVEPVVPVKRTMRYDPIHWSGPGNRATLLARVRPWSRSPRLAHPSTRTSCVLPTSATFLRRAMPRTAATSRSSRSPATGSGTTSLRRVA